MITKELNTTEEIEVLSLDEERPRGIRTDKHNFYMGIVFHAASSVFDVSEEGLSVFISTLPEKGNPRTLNDPEVAVDRFPFLDQEVTGKDRGKPFSYQQIANRLGVSASTVRRAEKRVVRKAIDVIFAYDLPRVTRLPF